MMKICIIIAHTLFHLSLYRTHILDERHVMHLQEHIYTCLSEKFQAEHVEVVNDSAKHQHHAASPQTGASHFAVTISSAQFQGCTRIERHRMVYDALQEALDSGVHALQIFAWTPEEFAKKQSM